MADQIEQLGKEIAAEFKERILQHKLDPATLALVERVSGRLAVIAIEMLTADPARKAILVIQRDAALATLENITLAEAIRAEQVMRQVVVDVLLKVIKVAIGVLA